MIDYEPSMCVLNKLNKLNKRITSSSRGGAFATRTQREIIADSMPTTVYKATLSRLDASLEFRAGKHDFGASVRHFVPKAKITKIVQIYVIALCWCVSLSNKGKCIFLMQKGI